MANSEFGILAVVAALGLMLLLGNKEDSVFIGAGITPAPRGITPAKPKPKGITPAKPKPKPKPKLVSRFNPKTTYRPIRNVKTQQGSHVQQLHKNLVRKYTLAQAWQKMTPIQKTRIINTWIERARRVMRTRILAAIKQQQSGYKTVGYSGGFGGTIAPNSPPLTGAVGANELSAWEEALGLKPITNTSKLSAAQARMQRTANDAITQYSKCEENKACQIAAAKKFDQIVFSKTTAMINSMRLANKGVDPTQSMV